MLNNVHTCDIFVFDNVLPYKFVAYFQGIGKSPKDDNKIKIITEKSDLNQIKTHF